jgi:thioredoxin-dependent peroxiredoxin
VNISEPAPNFAATSDTGQPITLEKLRGQWVILYFYPKDSSLGCSIEAQRFEQSLPEFVKLNAQVIGVSTGSSESQTKFREKCNLSFPLLPDTDKSIGKAYGVMGGLLGMVGIADRQTFLIDPYGNLAHHWKFVNPLSHATEVLQILEKQQTAMA